MSAVLWLFRWTTLVFCACEFMLLAQNSLDSCRSGGGKSELSEWERMVFVVMCVKAMEVGLLMLCVTLIIVAFPVVGTVLQYRDEE